MGPPTGESAREGSGAEMTVNHDFHQFDSFFLPASIHGLRTYNTPMARVSTALHSRFQRPPVENPF
jgi:hypothetical protein